MNRRRNQNNRYVRDCKFQSQRRFPRKEQAESQSWKKSEKSSRFKMSKKKTTTIKSEVTRISRVINEGDSKKKEWRNIKNWVRTTNFHPSKIGPKKGHYNLKNGSYKYQFLIIWCIILNKRIKSFQNLHFLSKTVENWPKTDFPW